MASEKRKPDSSIKDRLFDEFYRFSFFKAVDLMEKLYPDKKPLGRTFVPGEEPVRFSVKPGFVFPAGEILNLEQKDEDQPANMEVAFMGMIGPSGILPDWYNEMAIERNRQKDYTLTSFYDIFHHRLITMFYLAWKKYRFPENYQPGATDRLSKKLLSMIGLGTPGLSPMIGLPEESLIFYSGLLSRSVPSAISIEATVEYLADTPARVEQFIDRMLPLDEEDQTHIGQANISLGEDTVCGSYVWENQTKFRVNLGPMGYRDFLRFLPSGDMLGPIFSQIRYMVGIEYEFEIRVFLKRDEVPLCIVGADESDALQLGWTTWSKHPEVIHGEDPNATFSKPGQ